MERIPYSGKCLLWKDIQLYRLTLLYLEMVIELQSMSFPFYIDIPLGLTL